MSRSSGNQNGFIERISAVVFPNDATVVAECRRCGTTVDPDLATCPVCDAGEVVTYTIQ